MPRAALPRRALNDHCSDHSFQLRVVQYNNSPTRTACCLDTTDSMESELTPKFAPFLGMVGHSVLFSILSS